jgi:hypothetical protein
MQMNDVEIGELVGMLMVLAVSLASIVAAAT